MNGSSISVKLASDESERKGGRVEQAQSGGQPVTAARGSLTMFDVDRTGRLMARLPDARLGMDFRWRGRSIRTDLHSDAQAPTAVVTFRTQAGRIPSSALAAEARPDAFEVLRALPGLLPKDWTLTITPNHGLQLQGEAQVAMPALISDLLAPAVHFCLEAAPLFDLLEEHAIATRA